MNDRQKMIEELMKHPIGKDEGFRFHCNQCGECCRDRVDILLSPFDLCRKCFRSMEISIWEIQAKCH